MPDISHYRWVPTLAYFRLTANLEQLEAMQKLKGKAGQQKVTVEHVHVHEGGKAIVGAVSTGETQRERGEV